MGVDALVKIDIAVALLSLASVIGIFVRRGASVFQLRDLKKESKEAFRTVKSKIFTLMETKQEQSKEETEKVAKKKELSPEDHVEVQKRLRKVELLLANNELIEAEQLLVEALCYNPDDEDANTLLAYVYLKRRKYSKAESIYLHLIKMNTQDPSVYGNLGKVLEAQGNTESALLAYQEAIAKDTDNAGRYVQLAALQMKLDQYDLAVDAYEEAVKRDSRNIEYLFQLAKAYKQTASFKLSGKTLKRILEIEPYNEKAKIQYLELEERGYFNTPTTK